MADILSGTNNQDIFQLAKGMLDKQVAAMSESGQLPAKAAALYNNTQTLLGQPDPDAKFRSEFEKMSQDDLNAYSHLRLVNHLLNTGSQIIALRNRPDDGQNNAYNIEEMVKLASQAGYSAQDVEEFFSDVRLWKAITPHPTEHLNAKGIDLFRQLVAVGELPHEEREPALQNVIRGMTESPITPTRRLTTFEETDLALQQSQIYRSGQREMFRRVNHAVKEAFDGYIISPDLSSSGSKISTGLRTWHAGGDADGKANSDRWALIYGMLTLTKGAVEDHINDIERASRLVAEDDCDSLRGKFQQVTQPFTYVRQALEQLKDRIDLLESRFVSVDGEGNKSLKEGVDYDVIKQEFSSLFEGLKIGKIEFETRKGFERELRNYFKTLSQTLNNPEARQIMAESNFMMGQYGLSSAIIETRHNGIMMKQTMNNLFKDKAFIDSLNLPEDMQNLLSSKAMFTGVEDDAQGLTTEQQRTFIDYVNHNTTAQQRQETLLRANPPTKDSNGYTDQTHEILERYSIMALSPTQLGMAIIADADEMSVPYQRFLAESFGLTTLLHTPLNEEYETLKNMPEYLERNHRNGGQIDISERALSRTNGSWYGHNMVHGQMIPCSDSRAKFGLAVLVLETEGFRKAYRNGINLSIAHLLKRGNGESLGRGGGDEMMYTRYAAQELAAYAKERGTPLNHKDPHDRVSLQMASFFSNTEQGRGMRIHSATPKQVSEDLCDKIGEMLGRRLELEGLVHSGTFIPPRGVYTDKVRNFVMETAFDMMQLYSAYQRAESGNDDGAVLNNWAQIVSDPNLAGDANSSARAQSKSSGKKAQQLTAQRAIGKNIWHSLARTRHDECFLSGEFLERIHKKYSDSGLSKAGVKQFTIDSQWWRRNYFFRALMPAVSSDLKHGFKKLGLEDITFDEALELGRSVHIEEGVLKYDDKNGKFTPEQALQAAIFEDQVLLSALTEAGLSIDEVNSPYNKTIEELIKTVRPDDNSINVAFGPKTHKRWPQLAVAQEQARQSVPELAMTDYYEDRIREGHSIDEPSRKLQISSTRGATIPHIPTIMGREAYGRRKEPVWGSEALIAPPKNFRPEIPAQDIHEQPDHGIS